MITIDVPNLDAEPDPDALDQFSKDCGRLAAYAEVKAWSMRYRLRGDIQLALKYERRCEMIYNLLPPEWRW